MTQYEEENPEGTADTILRRGRIATMNGSRSFASAAAVRDGRFIAVGSDEEVMAFRGARTEVIDLAPDFRAAFGLGRKDIVANVNFFMNVPVTPEGGLTFADGVSGPGKYVEMRAEMDVIVLISNCPQLNNPCNAYNPTPIEVLIWDAA